VATSVAPPEAVEIVDPTHPLYGLRLPLVGIAMAQRHLGRVCRVWVAPGVERMVPIAATDRGGVRVPPSRARLTPAAVAALVAVVASVGDALQEDAHGPGAARPSAFAPTGLAARGGRSVAPAGAPGTTLWRTGIWVERLRVTAGTTRRRRRAWRWRHPQATRRALGSDHRSWLRGRQAEAEVPVRRYPP
jgi:hypothetical protein